MLLKNKVAKNAFWIIGCRIVQSVLTLVINMLTARYFGPSNYGLISYAASIVTFLTPIMNLGLTGVLVNELVKSPEKEGEILGTSLVLALISSFLCIGSIAAFVTVANPNEKDTLIVCTLYSIILIFQALELIQYWFQSKYLAKYTSLTVLFAYIVVSVYKIILFVTHKSIYWFAVSNAFDYALISGILLIIYRRKRGQKFKFSLNVAKHLLQQSKYYIVSGIMINVFAQTDRIMLKSMINNAEVGFYSAAVAIAGLTCFVFLAVIDSFRPLVLENKTKSQEKFEESVISLYSIVIYLAVFASVGIFILSEFLIRLLYGESYLPANTMLRIVIWYTNFSYFGCAKDVWLLAENKQKYLVVTNFSGAILNIVLNLILIPEFKGEGAAVASLITQFFTNIGMCCIIPDLRRTVVLLVRSLNPKVFILMLKQIISK